MSILAAVLLASGCYKNVWHTARGSLAAKMRDAISLGIVYIAQVQYEGNLADAHRRPLPAVYGTLLLHSWSSNAPQS